MSYTIWISALKSLVEVARDEVPSLVGVAFLMTMDD
jgi:hypothetical protein